MKEVNLKGIHRIEVRDDKGEPDIAELEIRYARIRVLPPIGKQKRYPALDLVVIHACERGEPRNRKSINWKLLTNMPVSSRKEAIEKLDWYAMRWKIETFHKILKSGCRAEDARLRTAERLTNLIALYCIVSWRVFWMTMLARVAPQAPRNRCTERTGNPAARQIGQGCRRDGTSQDPRALPDQDCPARRLSGTRQRSTTGQHGHMARAVTAIRYPARRRHRWQELWVIESR